MATVELRNISKVYEGGVKPADNSNLTINDKEFGVLVGPPGCGKATPLRMVAGLEEITSGELYIDGKMMNDVAPKDRDIAMVFQNYALYPHMTVFDNMAFGLKIRKYPKAEINQRVHEAAGILDIEELLERKPKALSGGQRQRVAVGRALVRKPQGFLFDEPLGLYNNPVNRFVAGFIGSPPMNFLKVTLRDQGGKLMADEGSFQLELTPQMAEALRSYVGKEVILGVRPEDLLYAEAEQPHNNIATKDEVVEPLGAEIYFWVSTTANQIVARVAPRFVFHVGDTANLHPDLAKVTFFDTA